MILAKAPNNRSPQRRGPGPATVLSGTIEAMLGKPLSHWERLLGNALLGKGEGVLLMPAVE